VREIPIAAARRIALAAQGFAGSQPAGRVDARHLRRTIGTVGLLQLDSVSAVCRSHYLPVLARLGPYPRARLDELAAHSGAGTGTPRPVDPERRELFEYWGHEASLLPVAMQPLLRWRMARAHVEAWGSVRRMVKENPGLIADVLELVRERGPIRASETGIARPKGRAGGMWDWHDGKIALEHLFFTGQVAASERVNFERRYDLSERVLPAAVLAAPTPTEPDAQRELLRIAARALGVASEPDLGDYFRLPRATSKARVAELVRSGELEEVAVEGWRIPGYLWPGSRRPREVRTRALLSPFDSLIWARERTKRLFGFEYRLEIYTPAAKRVYGYYVLPFLLGESLVARVDLRAERASGTLRVHGVYAEPGRASAHVARELAEELRLLCDWLGLEELRTERRGDLAAQLRAAIG
jgi:uncharacterized protein YcaQ